MIAMQPLSELKFEAIDYVLGAEKTKESPPPTVALLVDSSPEESELEALKAAVVQANSLTCPTWMQVKWCRVDEYGELYSEVSQEGGTWSLGLKGGITVKEVSLACSARQSGISILAQASILRQSSGSG